MDDLNCMIIHSVLKNDITKLNVCYYLDGADMCLFLNKVDSLRAEFNFKYVYVLKSLTMSSKKIDYLY